MKETGKETLRRKGTILLATVLCVSAMAGCGLPQQKPAGKTQTQQTQQADTAKTDTGKKDTASVTDTKKPEASAAPAATQKPAEKPKAPAATQKPAEKPKAPAATQKPAEKPKAPAVTQKPAEKPAAKQSAAPSIKTQPADVTVGLKGEATFVVEADGTDLKYSWQVDKNDGKGWTDIKDATSASYVIDKAGKEQNGWKYRCIVTNTSGSIVSEEVTLHISNTPEIDKLSQGSKKAATGKKT